MGSDESVQTSDSYLYACPKGVTDLTPATVFYKVEDESMAKSLCRLFATEHSDTDGKPTFHHQTVAGISPEEQVLLDEALEDLNLYDDPDRFIYEPPPPQDMIARAQYAFRARRWEEMLKAQMSRSCENTIDGHDSRLEACRAACGDLLDALGSCLLGNAVEIPADCDKLRQCYRKLEIRAQVCGETDLLSKTKPLIEEIKAVTDNLSELWTYRGHLTQARPEHVVHGSGGYSGSNELNPQVWDEFTGQVDIRQSNFGRWLEYERERVNIELVAVEAQQAHAVGDLREYLSAWLLPNAPIGGKGKGIYLWWTWGSVYPEEPTADLNERSYFYRVATEDLAARLCRAFGQEHGDDLRFGYTVGEALDIDEAVLANDSMAKYRRREFQGEDKNFFWTARQLKRLVRDEPGVKSQNQNASTGAGPAQNDIGTRIEEALDGLLAAVEKHRLTFLFFANAKRKNPSNRDDRWETLCRDERPEHRIPTDDIDNKGQFLFRHRLALDLFAETAVGRFGLGEGRKPSVLVKDGKWVEVEGGSLPFWSLDEGGCSYLEGSSNAILNACKTVAGKDLSGRLRSLVNRIIAVTHDNDQPKWYSSLGVRWRYLSDLDEVILAIKKARVVYPDDSGGSEASQEADRILNGPALADRAAKAVLAFEPSEDNKAELDLQTTTDIRTLIMYLRQLGRPEAGNIASVYETFVHAARYRVYGETVYDNESGEEQHDRLTRDEPEPDFAVIQSILAASLRSLALLALADLQGQRGELPVGESIARADQTRADTAQDTSWKHMRTTAALAANAVGAYKPDENACLDSNTERDVKALVHCLRRLRHADLATELDGELKTFCEAAERWRCCRFDFDTTQGTTSHDEGMALAKACDDATDALSESQKKLVVVLRSLELLTPSRATPSAEAVQQQSSNGDSEKAIPVHELASALTELRLATGELLTVSSKTDIYPEAQVKTYHDALLNVESRVDGVSQHLAYGRENPGQIKTQIREYLHNLARAMEHVASDNNDQPKAYPLDKETTEPGWEAMKDGIAIELVLAMTTLKPEDMQMPVEDRRVSGLVLLMLLAQAYYKMLECTISMASQCSAIDMELNHSYLWVTTSLTTLLKNHEDLKDFPTKFEPLFIDLYPSTIRDLDWDDMVAPDAEKFLSTVQQYAHSKGIFEPKQGSMAWTFVELYRPSVETAIKQAIAYNKRMRQYVHKAFGSSPQPDAGGNSQAGKDTIAQTITPPATTGIGANIDHNKQQDRVKYWVAFEWYQKYTKRKPRYRKCFCKLVGLPYKKKTGVLGIDTLERWAKTSKGASSITRHKNAPEVLAYLTNFKHLTKTSDTSEKNTSD
ncbi:MAG: hypothetical protein KAV00_13265 [Phycisphaerae bacterium]|nr:hypothetical protein [Phycisphaerae bacterium]